VETRLKAFEEALITPFVPGEIDGWLTTTARSFADLDTALRQLAEDHRRQLKEMQRQDDEIAARVAKLREEEQALLERLDRLAWHIKGLKKREGNGEGETQKLDLSAERLVEEALKFVIDVRKQEAAVTTWFMEAFQRDRGVAD
jgi:hypothetical protein